MLTLPLVSFISLLRSQNKPSPAAAEPKSPWLCLPSCPNLVCEEGQLSSSLFYSQHSAECVCCTEPQNEKHGTRATHNTASLLGANCNS